MFKIFTFSFLIVSSVILASCADENKKEKSSAKETLKKEVKNTKEEPAKPVKPKNASTAGMILFEGGTFQMGNDQGLANQQPAHEAKVKAFYLDKHPLTVATFRKFIEATGFVTEAENFGDAGVYDLKAKRWNLVKGATWEHPRGSGKPKAKDDHPVTQVSWNDAAAYAKWAGKRLPTEEEWEYAATNKGKMQTKYPWGSDKIKENGNYKANYWQGSLEEEQGADGHVYTSPVGAFGEYPSGLADMSGNVWEWCEDIYKPYKGSDVQHRPDPMVRVIRGGSFFYDAAGTKSCEVTFRAYNTIETSLFNMGFRCARDK